MTTSNTTIDTSITSPYSTLIPLILFCLVMTLFGIFGNGVVLYSSIRYNAIKLDKISVIFVRNLAAADVMYSLCVILPQLVTYIAQRWVLGKVYCIVMAQVGITPISANTLTVLAITSYRLYVIRSPFSRISTRIAYLLMGLTWVIGVIPVAVFVGYKSESAFHPENARCLSDIYDNEAAKVPVMALVGLIVVLPLICITAFNLILSGLAIHHSSKSNSTNYKALVMVCCLSGLFIVSWGPYFVFTILKSGNKKPSAGLDLAAFHCIFLNSFGNPILYTLTNRRFSKYVKGLICPPATRSHQRNPQLKSSSESSKATNSTELKALQK